MRLTYRAPFKRHRSLIAVTARRIRIDTNSAGTVRTLHNHRFDIRKINSKVFIHAGHYSRPWRDILTPMKILKAAVAAISAVLALQSASVVTSAINNSNRANLIDGAVCFILFSAYPIWFLIRRTRQKV